MKQRIMKILLKKDEPTSESWLNYTFHLNCDKSRELKLVVLIFHIPMMNKKKIN